MYDKLIRSKRRTLGLEITQNAEVILRVPESAKDSDLDNFLRKNAGWIERARKKILERQESISKIEFQKGAYVPHLGVSYPLGILLGGVREGKEKDSFLVWSKKEAHRICENYARIFAEKTEKSYTKIRITNAKKRWGSCASSGTLSFTWRLILGPLWVLEYVVAHEVAHLIHKNHGKRFWKKVETLYPEHKKARKWLKTHGHLLTIM